MLVEAQVSSMNTSRSGSRSSWLSNQAALQEQLLNVAIAKRIAQIPGDGLQDQRRFVVAALEVVLRPALQLLDNGIQDHAPPPVRRHPCGLHAQRRVNAKTLRQALSYSGDDRRGLTHARPRP